MSPTTSHIDSKTSLRGTKQTQPLVPVLRFKEFDGEWKHIKLGDSLTITSASRVHKDEWTESGVPFYRSSDVVAAFKEKRNTAAYISEKLFESLSNKTGRVKKNDLLVTGGGSIGIPYLVKNDDPLYFKDADLLWLKRTNDINGYFLYSYLTTPLFKKYLKSISHIGTIAHYTVVQAKNTPCNLPTLPEQQKIASFLSAVDEKIQQLRQKKALLEKYKKGVMQKLFPKKAGQAPELRFKKTDDSNYPDWEEKKLGEASSNVCYGMNSAAKPFDGVNKYLRITDIEESSSSFDESKITSPEGELEEKYKVLKGDILFARTGASVGKSYLHNSNDESVYFAGFLIRFSISKGVPMFMFYQTQTYSYFKWVKVMSMRSGQPGINAEEYKTFPISFPSTDEQQKIADFLSGIDQKINQVETQINQTQTFKKGLLQQMFV